MHQSILKAFYKTAFAVMGGLALLAFIMGLSATTAKAQTVSPRATFTVLTANTDQYKTNLLIASPNAGPLNLGANDFGWPLKIDANGAFKQLAFGGPGINVRNIDAPAGSSVSTYIISRNSDGVYTSFEVPAFLFDVRFMPDGKGGFTRIAARFSPIESEGDTGTYLIAVNAGEATATIAVDVYDGAGEKIASEQFTAPKGAASLYKVQAEVKGAGSLVVSSGGCGFGWCSPAGPTYVFASVNTAAGGAPRVLMGDAIVTPMGAQ